MSRRGKLLLAAGLLQEAEGAGSRSLGNGGSHCNDHTENQSFKRKWGDEEKRGRGGEGGGDKICRREGNEIESTRREISENFRCLHFVINSFAKRRLAATVDSVQKIMREMTGRSFSKTDLCIILGACGAVVVQRVDDTEAERYDRKHWRHFVLRLNAAWLPSASPVPESSSSPAPPVAPINTFHVPIETKLAHFDILIKQCGDFLPLRVAGEQQLLALQSGVTPSSPQPHKLSATTGAHSSFKSLLRRDVHQDQDQRAMTSLLAIDQGQAAVDIAALKQQVVTRHSAAEKRNSEVAAGQQQAERLGAIAALPRLADSLRSMALARNLTCFPLKAMAAALAEQMQNTRCNTHVTQGDAAALTRHLRALARLVPEFVQIFPADRILAYESLRVNLHAPYKSVRQKVKSIADVACKERTQLMHTNLLTNGH